MLCDLFWEKTFDFNLEVLFSVMFCVWISPNLQVLVSTQQPRNCAIQLFLQFVFLIKTVNGWILTFWKVWVMGCADIDRFLNAMLECYFVNLSCVVPMSMTLNLKLLLETGWHTAIWKKNKQTWHTRTPTSKKPASSNNHGLVKLVLMVLVIELQPIWKKYASIHRIYSSNWTSLFQPSYGGIKKYAGRHRACNITHKDHGILPTF